MNKNDKVKGDDDMDDHTHHPIVARDRVQVNAAAAVMMLAAAASASHNSDEVTATSPPLTTTSATFMRQSSSCSLLATEELRLNYHHTHHHHDNNKDDDNEFVSSAVLVPKFNDKNYNKLRSKSSSPHPSVLVAVNEDDGVTTASASSSSKPGACIIGSELQHQEDETDTNTNKHPHNKDKDDIIMEGRSSMRSYYYYPTKRLHARDEPLNHHTNDDPHRYGKWQRLLSYNDDDDADEEEEDVNATTTIASLSSSSSYYALFPMQLHCALSHPSKKCKLALEWLPHGSSWRVLRWEALDDILPAFFPECSHSIDIFLDMVEAWGFIRTTPTTAATDGMIGSAFYSSRYYHHNAGSYFHEYFQLDAPGLCQRMKLRSSNIRRAFVVPSSSSSALVVADSNHNNPTVKRCRSISECDNSTPVTTSSSTRDHHDARVMAKRPTSRTRSSSNISNRLRYDDCSNHHEGENYYSYHHNDHHHVLEQQRSSAGHHGGHEIVKKILPVTTQSNRGGAHGLAGNPTTPTTAYHRMASTPTSSIDRGVLHHHSNMRNTPNRFDLMSNTSSSFESSFDDTPKHSTPTASRGGVVRFSLLTGKRETSPFFDSSTSATSDIKYNTTTIKDDFHHQHHHHEGTRRAVVCSSSFSSSDRLNCGISGGQHRPTEIVTMERNDSTNSRNTARGDFSSFASAGVHKNTPGEDQQQPFTATTTRVTKDQNHPLYENTIKPVENNFVSSSNTMRAYSTISTTATTASPYDGTNSALHTPERSMLTSSSATRQGRSFFDEPQQQRPRRTATIDHHGRQHEQQQTTNVHDMDSHLPSILVTPSSSTIRCYSSPLCCSGRGGKSAAAASTTTISTPSENVIKASATKFNVSQRGRGSSANRLRHVVVSKHNRHTEDGAKVMLTFN